MLWNMIEICGGSMLIYAVSDPRNFALVCLCGVLLGAGLWWLCLFVARNWNRSYRLVPAQHALCALAALWTFVFCIAFVSVTAVDGYFDRLVDEWGAAVHASVGEMSLPDALQQFETQFPFVRAVLQSGGEDGQVAGLAETLRSNAATAIDSVTGTLKDEFRERVDWAVFRLRLFLLLSFLLLQAVVFGLIGFAAHRDIRPAF